MCHNLVQDMNTEYITVDGFALNIWSQNVPVLSALQINLIGCLETNGDYVQKKHLMCPYQEPIPGPQGQFKSVHDVSDINDVSDEKLY